MAPQELAQSNLEACLIAHPKHPRRFNLDMGTVATIIMGGGQGSRLFPLTKARCKPAMTFGGKYRLIDIPISNALNSGCKKIFILTQFLARTLHHHILSTYRPDSLTSSFVEVLPAEEKLHGKNWFEGTADAVRQNLDYFRETPADYFLILSGDQLYNIDFRNMVHFAQETEADVVIASLPIGETEARRMGVMQIDESNAITSFHEKPQLKRDLNKMALPPKELKRLGLNFETDENKFLGSMGIYLFKREALFNLLKTDPREDFGKHLIPTKVKEGGISAYIHQGYWEDIGTVSSFYQANIDLTTASPFFDSYNESWPIFSHQTMLPGARINNTQLKNSLVCEGAIIDADEITQSIIGPRSIIGKGSIIRDSYLMGNDFYSLNATGSNLPSTFSIGENCIIKKAIIDKQSSIGHRVQLINKENLQHLDNDNIYIRDGIIVVPRGAVLPDGFIL